MLTCRLVLSNNCFLAIILLCLLESFLYKVTTVSQSTLNKVRSNIKSFLLCYKCLLPSMQPWTYSADCHILVLDVNCAVHWLICSVSIAVDKYLKTQNSHALELATFQIIVQGGFQPKARISGHVNSRLIVWHVIIRPKKGPCLCCRGKKLKL